MINARFMYLRPGNLFKDFVVESNTQVVTASGRVANAPKGDGSKIIRGCLAESTKKMQGLSVLQKLLCLVSAMVADADLVEWNYTYNTVKGEGSKEWYGL